MGKRTVGVHEAKTQLSRLLREVEDGGEVVVTRSGRPVARIVAPEGRLGVAGSRGRFRGQVHWDDDAFTELDAQIADDFDMPG
ncbi:hypothetical protein BH24ACT3_BH24ACT3_06970 [soil metagenome]